MQYIVQKPFTFGGTQYKTGMVFDPSKYPMQCTMRKLRTLVDTRFVIEDFRLPQKPTHRDTKPQDAVPAPESAKMSRSTPAE